MAIINLGRGQFNGQTLFVQDFKKLPTLWRIPKEQKRNTQGKRKKQWQTSHRYRLIDIEISYRLYKWAWLENRFANFTILLATPRQTYKCQQIFNDFIKMANPFPCPPFFPCLFCPVPANCHVQHGLTLRHIRFALAAKQLQLQQHQLMAVTNVFHLSACVAFCYSIFLQLLQTPLDTPFSKFAYRFYPNRPVIYANL